MNIDRMEALVADKIKKVGSACEIKTKNGDLIKTTVHIQSLWQNTKTLFETHKSMLGEIGKGYYRAIFLPSVDVTSLGRNDTLTVGNQSFYVVKSSPVVVSDRVLFFRAVIKEILEDENAFI